MKKWVCKVCGYVYTGETPPEFCPQCKAPASKFEEQVSGEVTWADEHRIGVAEGVDPEILEGLRQNFQGECTEAGVPANVRQNRLQEKAIRKLVEYYKTAAFEEAEHAAKFAELLGEVVTNSTKKNLELRVAAGRLAPALKEKDIATAR